jgi:hypothetical protein
MIGASNARARRPHRLRSSEAIAYFVVAALLEVAVGARAQPAAWHGYLSDPDTLMRLVRLRDILAQQAPLHVVMRDSSGDGTILHWSHLLDSLLLLLAAPLRPFFGWDQALRGAAIAFGPIGVGLLGSAAAWASAPFAARDWRWTGPVLVALSPTIASYGLPGVADHHVLLALGAVMMAGAAGRVAAADVTAGLTLGVWSAASIWLSPEAMPFALLAFGGAGLAWLLRPDEARIGAGIALAGTAFLLLTAAALAVDPPAGGFLALTIDGISIVYLLLAVVTFAIGWGLFILDRMRIEKRWRGTLGAAVAVVGMLAWVGLFPVMLRGPEALGDTPDARAMYHDIQEMLPVTSLADIATLLMSGAAAGVLLAWLAVRDRSSAWQAAMWAYAAVCTVALELLGQRHVRFTTYPAVAAATLLPVALAECTRLTAGRPPIVQAIARVGLLALLFLSTRTDALAGVLIADHTPMGKPVSQCNLESIAPMVAPAAGQVVLTAVNDVPGLLYRTDVRTVGSLYPGGVAGYSRLHAAWLSGPSDTVPEELRAARVDFVLYCPQIGRPDPALGAVSESLWYRLARAEVPGWLQAVASDSASGVVLYAVVGHAPAPTAPGHRR